MNIVKSVLIWRPVVIVDIWDICVHTMGFADQHGEYQIAQLCGVDMNYNKNRTKILERIRALCEYALDYCNACDSCADCKLYWEDIGDEDSCPIYLITDLNNQLKDKGVETVAEKRYLEYGIS